MVKEISTDKIWGILNTIPDPEIPAISIVDLGIIREVQYDEHTLTITITGVVMLIIGWIRINVLFEMLRLLSH